MSKPQRDHLDSKVSSRLFNKSLRGMKGMGLFWGIHRAGWLATRFRKERPSILPSSLHIVLILPAVSWRLQVRMVFGGPEGQFPACTHTLTRNTESHKKIWQEQSLALEAFHFNSLFSTLSISLRRKMCILKVADTFWRRRWAMLCYGESSRASKNSDTSWREGPVWLTLVVVWI